jgi:very-short-patch-repair endonuclease
MTRPKSSILTKAKSLRSNQTDAEARLWYHLRANRFMGLKFKRQKPVGRYIADFVCWERRLIIELDGGQHAEQTNYDRQRDGWLRSEGYTVLRFWNHEVMQEMEAVLERIRLAVVAEPFPLAPPPQVGEGKEEAVKVIRACMESCCRVSEQEYEGGQTPLSHSWERGGGEGRS